MTGTQAHAQTPTTLGALRDHSRVLLIFAGYHDPRVEQQWSTLVEQRKQAAQRDLVTVLLTRSLTKKHDGERPPQAVLSSGEEQRLRQLFRIASDEFAVILVGKDGGEKLRSNDPISWESLAGTIDAMPMRQDEMRHGR